MKVKRNKTETTTFRFTPEDRARLQELADEHGVSVSDVIRMLIRGKIRVRSAA